MKIADVSVLIHNRKSRLKGFGGSASGSMPMGVLSITTDDGIVGNAFISGPGPGPKLIAEQIINTMKPLLVGKDALARTQIWLQMSRMSRVLVPGTVGAIDVALWDIAGKAANMPIHALLGTHRETIPAYLSSWVHERPEDYVNEALHYQEEGWKGYKLHPLTQHRAFSGREVPVSADIATCTLIRDAVGDEMELMLDSAWAYTYKEAIDVGLAIQDLNYLWYEDPLANSDDIYGYAKLREKLNIPILATETTEGGVFAYPSWLAQRGTDALRGDPVIKGGITGMMKIAHLAEAYRLNCEVHDSYSSLMNVAALHIAASISNTTSFEVLTINPIGEYGLQNASYGLIDPLVVTDGMISAPQKPGLGHDIDWELIHSDVLTVLE